MPVRKVLIPLDGSELSEQIVPAVCRLFEPEQTELTLLAVAQPLIVWGTGNTPVLIPAYSMYGTDYRAIVDYETERRQWQRYQRDLQSVLDEKAEALREAGYKTATYLRIGDPVQEIVTCAEENQHDLLAMATHGRTGMSRLFMGSVVEKVLHNVSIPILLMRPSMQAASDSTPAEKLVQSLVDAQPLTIAVATDGTPLAKNAIPLACTLSERLKTNLNVLLTIDEHENIAHSHRLMHEIHEQLAEVAPHTEAIPLVGRSEVVIERYLGEHPVDLLVIGAFRDRGAGAKEAIGLTAQRITQHTPASVLVAKGHHTSIQKILVCLNVDDTAILDAASQFATALGAELQLLHVIAPQTEGKSKSEKHGVRPLDELLTHGIFYEEATDIAIEDISLDSVLEGNDGHADLVQTTEAVLDQLKIDRNALLVRRGPIAQTILETSGEMNPDLVMVGSQSGPGFFLGSVASRIVQLAPQSVLVIRTKSK